MTLDPEEFIRRFLLHVLPAGLHRIRHYGLFANTTRKNNLARARELLMGNKTDEATDAATHRTNAADDRDESATHVCTDFGVPMRIIDTFLGAQLPHAPAFLNRVASSHGFLP